LSSGFEALDNFSSRFVRGPVSLAMA
jgi:hypothetical protein